MTCGRVLERSQQVARETEGAFDITCGRGESLRRKARREKKLPDPVKLEEAKRAVGLIAAAEIRAAHTLNARAVHAPRPRAIAKGYAVDEAIKVLRARGIQSALVSGGGDMAVSAAPPGTHGWRIELDSTRRDKCAAH